jgi:catechol 2,3-dioxygenase-like lactoylglutathione lyase family enzyme
VLGRFLELSLATADIQASLHFYGELGFSQAEVGEAWPHPYAVVTDGRICVGLHQRDDFVPSVTFVKPDLLKHMHLLEDLGVRLEFRHLGNHVFNEIGWLDPSGNLIRMVEARTFSPSKRQTLEVSSCGYFLEIALPASNLASAKEYWERFGFVGMEESDAPLPHIACTSDTVDIGLYEPIHVREPTLLFEVDDFVKAAATLDALGLTPGRLPGPLRGTAAAILNAPEGTPLLLAAAKA